MGTAQKQNISCQHRYFNNHGGRQTHRPEPMSFQEWLVKGMEHYRQQGFKFELVTNSMMRISRPGKSSILRTAENFREEYEKEYLSKF
jgi:hypothetical protein